jgi:hypothetical protein
VDSILVSQPITTLDGVVHMPSPVILGHVTQSGVDTTLRCDSVRTSREELGDTGSLESGFGETESSSETSATGTTRRRGCKDLFLRRFC